jgi:hypothetical protein
MKECRFKNVTYRFLPEELGITFNGLDYDVDNEKIIEALMPYTLSIDIVHYGSKDSWYYAELYKCFDVKVFNPDFTYVMFIRIDRESCYFITLNIVQLASLIKDLFNVVHRTYELFKFPINIEV